MDLAREMRMDRRREISVFGTSRIRSARGDSSKEPDTVPSEKFEDHHSTSLVVWGFKLLT